MKKVVKAFFLLLATTIWVSTFISGAFAQEADACLEPIEFEPEASSKVPLEKLIFTFRPLPREICLPKKGGGCLPKSEVRVGMTITAVIAGGTFQSFVSQGVRKEMTEQGYLPEYDGLDTSIGTIASAPTSRERFHTHFGFHAEKWGSMTGFCCSGFKCRKCEWKTRLWERTVDVDIDSSQRINEGETELSFKADSVGIEDTPTWMEFLAGIALVSLIMPDFGLIGIAVTDVAFKEIIENIEEGIGSPSTPLPGQSIAEYVQAYFGTDQVGSYYWPRLEQMLNAMVIEPSATGFQLGSSWNYQFSKMTLDDAKGLFEYADFCAAIRPILEQKAGALASFKPLTTEIVQSSGNFSANHLVVDGESVWRLAKEFYNNEDLYRFVLRVNEIGENGVIFPGQELVLPSIESIVKSGVIVGRGDTLWGISEEVYSSGDEYRRLAKQNDVADPDWIYPLDVLVP